MQRDRIDAEDQRGAQEGQWRGPDYDEPRATPRARGGGKHGLPDSVQRHVRNAVRHEPAYAERSLQRLEDVGAALYAPTLRRSHDQHAQGDDDGDMEHEIDSRNTSYGRRVVSAGHSRRRGGGGHNSKPSSDGGRRGSTGTVPPRHPQEGDSGMGGGRAQHAAADTRPSSRGSMLSTAHSMKGESRLLGPNGDVLQHRITPIKVGRLPLRSAGLVDIPEATTGTMTGLSGSLSRTFNAWSTPAEGSPTGSTRQSPQRDDDKVRVAQWK